jgi:hypothetical protein
VRVGLDGIQHLIDEPLGLVRNPDVMFHLKFLKPATEILFINHVSPPITDPQH